MTNNLESDVKYIPYKEVIKKRALEYYYADKEVISQKRKDKYKQLPIEDKKSCKSIIKNGLIRKCLKNSLNYDKKHENIIQINMII